MCSSCNIRLSDVALAALTEARHYARFANTSVEVRDQHNDWHSSLTTAGSVGEVVNVNERAQTFWGKQIFFLGIQRKKLGLVQMLT